MGFSGKPPPRSPKILILPVSESGWICGIECSWHDESWRKLWASFVSSAIIINRPAKFGIVALTNPWHPWPWQAPFGSALSKMKRWCESLVDEQISGWLAGDVKISDHQKLQFWGCWSFSGIRFPYWPILRVSFVWVFLWFPESA